MNPPPARLRDLEKMGRPAEQAQLIAAIVKKRLEEDQRAAQWKRNPLVVFKKWSRNPKAMKGPAAGLLRCVHLYLPLLERQKDAIGEVTAGGFRPSLYRSAEIFPGLQNVKVVPRSQICSPRVRSH